MARFLIKRILISLFVVFIVSVFSFSLIQFLPGDPARLALGYEASEADVQALREEMNLDKPVLTQYFLWVGGLFQGDMGRSIIHNRPVSEMLAERLPRTVAIGFPALLIAAPLGILVGVGSAVKRGKFLDQALTTFTTLFMGMPVFWLGIFSIYIFAIWLHIFPIQGFTSPAVDFGEYLHKAVLPVMCLALGMVAIIARQTRTNMLDSLNQDYIRTVRANGLGEGSAIYKHALKNALIPVITIIGIQVRTVIGGSVLIENVFNIPGLGTMLATGISDRDYLVVQNCTLVVALITVGANLIVDILYGVIDPRIRLAKR